MAAYASIQDQEHSLKMGLDISGQDPCVLEVDNVSKKYCVDLRQLRRYGLHDIVKVMLGIRNSNETLRPGEFWAVHNVSFSMKKGESLGLIGLNGAGKSTLLKMIKGLIIPDAGKISIKGEVGALIELGAGFHPMLSGRENIFIKGALLGKSKEEMDAVYEKIVEFAELGDFIEAPLKSYSSGMHVRLGFAIAIFMKPDILLLDEVLAVGDFKFRQKCLEKINRIKETTATIFVSHSMDTISLFCAKAIVLEKGRIAFSGEADEAIQFYISEIEEKKAIVKKQKDLHVKKMNFGDLYENINKIVDIEHYWADSDLNEIDEAQTGQEVNIVIRFKLTDKPMDNLIVGVPIWNVEGTLITGIATDMDKTELIGDSENRYNVILNFKELALNPNEYIAVVAVSDGLEFYYRGLIKKKLVVRNYNRHFGFVSPAYNWIIK
jgi:lipopolysaccharide transport system ATP-binding protein